MSSTPKKISLIASVIVTSVLLIVLLFNSFIVVPVGHVKVGSLYGNVKNKVYTNGFHIVNPFLSFTEFDIRNKSAYFSQVPVPTEDQLTSNMDVRVQYRIIGADTPSILENTGFASDLIKVKLNSEVYSVLRDSTKTVKQAEDFFKSSTQTRLQNFLLGELKQRLTKFGINVQRVLLSNIKLPAYIVKAIHAKKVREQQVQQEKAELQRIQIQSQQKVARAKSAYQASQQQAKSIKVLADAKAYQIKTLRQSVGSPQMYIQLKAINALKEMAKDPSSKFYFLNAESHQPFPLLNIGKKT